MWNGVEVLGQIRIHHIGVAFAERAVYDANCVQRTPFRPIAKASGRQIRLENWFKHQFGSRLDNPVPDGRNTEWPCTAPGLGKIYPSHRLGLVTLHTQVFCQTRQPALNPCRLDHRKGNAIHARSAAIGFRLAPSVEEYIGAINLVVQEIKAEVRFRLRFDVELPLKSPDVIGCCQAHRQSPPPRLHRTACRKSGAFPPPALPGFNGTMCPSDSRTVPPPESGVRGRDPRPARGSHVTRNTF